MRAGELLALQWEDINWRSSRLEVRRNIVGGLETDPEESSALPRRPVASAARGIAPLAAAARRLAEVRQAISRVGVCVGHGHGPRRIERPEGV
jgi:integrase